VVQRIEVSPGVHHQLDPLVHTPNLILIVLKHLQGFRNGAIGNIEQGMMEGVRRDADLEGPCQTVPLPLFHQAHGILDDLRREVLGGSHLILGVTALDSEDDGSEDDGQ
jgi:hypothetical protein